MVKTLRYIPLVLLATACGSTQTVTKVHDDVYDIPDRKAIVAARAAADRAAAEQRAAQARNEDYYDDGVAGTERQQRAGSARTWDYYDAAYNDPYWYNSGRFGFGMGLSPMGMMSGVGFNQGWGMPMGYGMGMGYGIGYGMGMYAPFGSPWMGGYGGFHDPWRYGGYGMGMYGGGMYGMYGGMYSPYYGMGGFGPYRGPYGNCVNCYEPVGYSRNTVVAPRTSLTGSNSGRRPAANAYRNPAGLVDPRAGVRSGGARAGFADQVRTAEQVRQVQYNGQGRQVAGTRSAAPTRQVAPSAPQQREPQARPVREQPNYQRNMPAQQRTQPARQGGFDRSGGTRSPGGFSPAPSRGGGGGTRPSSPRPR